MLIESVMKEKYDRFAINQWTGYIAIFDGIIGTLCIFIVDSRRGSCRNFNSKDWKENYNILRNHHWYIILYPYLLILLYKGIDV